MILWKFSIFVGSSTVNNKQRSTVLKNQEFKDCKVKEAIRLVQIAKDLFSLFAYGKDDQEAVKRWK